MRQLGQRISSIALSAALKPVETAIGGLFGSLASALGGLSGPSAGSAGAAPTVTPSPRRRRRGADLLSQRSPDRTDGEAGAEAILPLKRGGGRHARVAAGGGGARSQTVVFNVSTPMRRASAAPRHRCRPCWRAPRSAAGGTLKGTRHDSSVLQRGSGSRFASPSERAADRSGGPRSSVFPPVFETRNQRHRHSVRRYDAGSGVAGIADLVAVLDFFVARRGSLSIPVSATARLQFHPTGPLRLAHRPDARRRRRGDPGFRSAEDLRTGTAPIAARSRSRSPIPAHRQKRDGTRQRRLARRDDRSRDLRRRARRGAALTAGFEFDVPVRFDIDQLVVNARAFERGTFPPSP